MQKIDFGRSAIRNGRALSRTDSRLELVLEQCGGGVTLAEAPGTEYRYLTGFITIGEEHSLPLTVRFFLPGESEEHAYIRFVILPQMRTRVCFDLEWLDMSKGGLHRTPGTLKQVIHGQRADIREVDRVELGVKEVFHDVRLVFEEFVLTDEMPDDFPLPDGKLVDEFGQYKRKDWPGKIHSAEELAAAMKRNEGPAEYPVPSWNRWGGDSARRLKEGTGFFSTCKTADGRWHLTDPDGCDYFSMGPCCVRPDNMGCLTGMKKMLEWLPEPDGEMHRLFYSRRLHPWYPEEMEQFNFSGANLYRVYGDRWEEKWKELTYHILMSNGINSQGNAPGLDVNNGRSRLPYVRQLPDFPTTEDIIFRDFPDVLAPEYARNSERFAARLAEWREDPWLIGYFLRNEPGFNFVPGILIADEVLRNPKPTFCKKGLIAFLREKYADVEALNARWGTAFDSFAGLEAPVLNCSERYPGSQKDIREYSVFLVKEYCRIPSEACRRVDPNHLNLGLRWSRMNNPAMLAGWEYMDVFSFNCYSFDPLPDLEFVSAAGVDRPVMVGEFHCGALDRGLTSTGLKGVENQYERGVMWREFVERCAGHPLGVGAHWFEYQDEFCLGRFDGENYQIGLVDICMSPYEEMMEAARETAKALYAVKNGEREPYGRMPKTIPMIG